ncbi:MAG: hypothetical protein EOO70_01205 [Myxococcaceae bacterium]|nr:MAG: hypothetical protein EOO70_01205 [Myxococcaceae bacterium]
MSLARSTWMEALRDNSAFCLREALGAIEHQAPSEVTGHAYFDAAWRYRRMAVCELLLEGRQDRFAGFLYKSALLQQHLQHLASTRQGIQVAHLSCSLSEVPVNALVVGCLEHAEATARGMLDRHVPDVEYEDDFLLFRIMGALLLKARGAQDADLPRLLKRWSTVLQNEEGPYLDVCRALSSQDEPGFSQAFESLVEDRVRQCERVRRERGAEGEPYLSEAFVFMKGLALLRLAELLGMRTLAEYPLIPRFARLPVAGPLLPSMSWRIPEQGMPA